MRKLTLLLCSAFLLSSCAISEHKDLNSMEVAVRQYFKNNDAQNDIHTNILELKALSYRELDASEKQTEADYYVCELYFKAKWSYLSGGRVYNSNDTIKAYFNKGKGILRVGDVKNPKN